MKHMENYVVMTKTELEEKVASQSEMTFGRKYDKGDVTFTIAEWYMSKMNGNTHVPPSSEWKKVVLES